MSTANREPTSAYQPVEEIRRYIEMCEGEENPCKELLYLRTLLTALDAQAAELRAQDELHGLQLAAISTASIMNTETSTKEWAIGRDHPYCTQAYLDVCGAVKREMAERERAETAERELVKKSTPPAAPSELARELLRRASTVEHCGEDHISVADAEVLINRALTRREPEGLSEPELSDIAGAVVRNVSELPGYTSPEDQPDLVTCTVKELEGCVLSALSHLSAQPGREEQE